jgi:hypothetical protein
MREFVANMATSQIVISELCIQYHNATLGVYLNGYVKVKRPPTWF